MQVLGPHHNPKDLRVNPQKWMVLPGYGKKSQFQFNKVSLTRALKPSSVELFCEAPRASGVISHL
jgi:hypothetical protein